jgi:hypothetical protein
MTTRITQPSGDDASRRQQRYLLSGGDTPITNGADAYSILQQWLVREGPARGPFQPIKDQPNQQLPGISIPAWLVQVLNMLAGHPALPYNYERPTLHRDIIFFGAAALVEALMQTDPDDPDVSRDAHVLASELALRKDMFIEELHMNYIENIAVAAQALQLRINAGSYEGVFTTLQSLFGHVAGISDREFWRPTILQLLLNVPEVEDALKFLARSAKHNVTTEFQAWTQMLDASREEG